MARTIPGKTLATANGAPVEVSVDAEDGAGDPSDVVEILT
jgi:hypothetical protein